jgi:hypothetical protein
MPSTALLSRLAPAEIDGASGVHPIKKTKPRKNARGLANAGGGWGAGNRGVR